VLAFATIVRGIVAAMRPSQIDEVLETLDSFFKQLGVKGGYAEAASIIESGIGDREDPNSATIIDIGIAMASGFFRISKGESLRGFQNAIAKARKYPTPDQLRRKLAAGPDLTAADYLVLKTLKWLPRAAKRSLKVIQRKIIPKGGHPFLVPRSDYAEICKEITGYIGGGDKVGKAKLKAAKLHGCKVSTIDKIWSKRGR